MTIPSTAGPRSRPADQTFIQRDAEKRLTPNPFRVELRGNPQSLTWPSVCANCGATASEQILVRKAFARPRRTSRHGRRSGITGFSTAGARIPFCGECASEHRETVERKSAVGNLLAALLTPMMIPMAGSAYFFVITLRAVLDNPPNGEQSQLMWALPGLMAAIFVWSFILSWRDTTADRLEAQTEVTRACDFSDDVSWLFDRERRIYSMRNEAFARAFTDANREQVWTAVDDERTNRRRRIVFGAAALVGAGVWFFVVLTR